MERENYCCWRLTFVVGFFLFFFFFTFDRNHRDESWICRLVRFIRRGIKKKSRDLAVFGSSSKHPQKNMTDFPVLVSIRSKDRSSRFHRCRQSQDGLLCRSAIGRDFP